MGKLRIADWEYNGSTVRVSEIDGLVQQTQIVDVPELLTTAVVTVFIDTRTHRCHGWIHERDPHVGILRHMPDGRVLTPKEYYAHRRRFSEGWQRGALLFDEHTTYENLLAGGRKTPKWSRKRAFVRLHGTLLRTFLDENEEVIKQVADFKKSKRESAQEGAS